MSKMTSRPGSGMKHLQELVTGLQGVSGRVGFFDSAKYNDATQTPIAYVAAIQEHGAPSAGVPSRPFMRPTIDRESATWKKLFELGTKSSLKGETKPEDVMALVVETAAGDVVRTLSDLTDPPLSKVTLLARKYKAVHGPNSITGKKMIVNFMHQVAADPDIDVSGVSTKPLNDTGALVAHVQGLVEKE